MHNSTSLDVMQLSVISLVVVSAAVHGNYDSWALQRYNRGYCHRREGYAIQNAGGHYYWGSRSPSDRLLYQARAYHTFQAFSKYYSTQSTQSVRYGFWGKVTLDMDFPTYNHRPLGTITFIEIQHISGPKARNICLVKGGVGHSFVTVHLESLFNCGLDYSIRIYGSYRPTICQLQYSSC